jgi:cysteine desulfurase/selenocysteine lyase
MAINVRALNVDFLAFSGHKMGGPEGVGVLFCAERTHGELNPGVYGGGMVAGVSSNIQYRAMPHLLEAGTPHAAGAYGLVAAIEYLQSYDRQALATYVHNLTAQARIMLEKVPGVRIISDPQSSAIISFVCEGIHSHDVAAILGQQGVLVRAGFHCAQPLHEALKLPQGSVRASFSGYNTLQDIRALETSLRAI